MEKANKFFEKYRLQILVFSALLVVGVNYAYAQSAPTPMVSCGGYNVPQGTPCGPAVHRGVAQTANVGTANVGGLSTAQMIAGGIGALAGSTSNSNQGAAVAGGALAGVIIGGLYDKSQASEQKLASADTVVAEQAISEPAVPKTGAGNCTILKNGEPVKKVRAASAEDCKKKQKKFEEDDSK